MLSVVKAEAGVLLPYTAPEGHYRALQLHHPEVFEPYRDVICWDGQACLGGRSWLANALLGGCPAGGNAVAHRRLRNADIRPGL